MFRACFAVLALAASTTVPADELRLRALLVTQAAADTPAIDLGLRGEARVIVHEDGQARLDLVGWALPAALTDVVVQLGTSGDSTTPLLAVPLVRDADEGRVIGAGFRLDADLARRLRSGEGQVLLMSVRQPGTVVRGSLQPHPRTSGAPARTRLQVAD